MNTSPTNHAVPSPEPISIWERWAFLFGRLIVFTAMVYVPLVFYGMVWHSYHPPKIASCEFLMMLLVLCWLIIAAKRRFVRSPLATPVAFFFMFVMISMLFAVQLTESWETIWFLLSCLTIMILIPKFLYSRKDFEIIAYLLGLMCIVVDLYALGQFLGNPNSLLFQITSNFGVRWLSHKPVSFMGNENYAAEFLNMIIPICVMMMICYRRRAPELIFFSIATLFNAVTMIYIDCNASYVGFAVSIPVMGYLLLNFKAIPWGRRIGLIRWSRLAAERNLRHGLIGAILLMSLGATVIASLSNPVRTKMASMASWVDMDGDMIPDGVAPIVFRLQCMDAAMQNIKDSFFFGIGPGNFKVMHPLYESQLERKVLGEETLARKVHNDHLYHAVEFGVFGLFCWYWIIATVYFLILRSLKFLEIHDLCLRGELIQGERPKRLLKHHTVNFLFYLQLGILGGLTVALMSTAFGHTFVIASSAITFWILCGVSVAVYQFLYFAQRGIPLPKLGTTKELLTPIQAYTQRIPDYAKYIILFLMLLPLGTLNICQYTGELWINKGISAGSKAEETGDYTESFYYFDRAMEYYPYQMEIYYILGRYYIDAIVAMEKVLDNGGAAAANLLPKVMRIENRKKLNDKGIVILQTDLFMNPNYKWAHNNLGVLYDRLKEYYDPNSRFADIYKAPPNPVQVESVNQASLETYFRVLDIDREQVYAHFNLGLGAMKEHHFDLAIDELNRALMVDPLRFDIYRYLAGCFLEIKDYKRAMMASNKFMSKTILAFIQQSIQDKRMRQEKIIPILDALEQDDHISAASRAKLILGWQDEQISNLYFTIAVRLAENKENQEMAFKALRLSDIVKTESDPEVILWHAQVYKEYDQLDRSADKLEEYIRIDPNKEEVLKLLGEIYTIKGNLDKAEKTWNHLVGMRPNNWTYMTTLARVRVGLNRPWPQVAPLLYKALEIGGDDVRQDIVQTTQANNLLDKIKDDPQLQQLLGPNFYNNNQ